MDPAQDLLESFLALSTSLTGFDRVDLLGTGLAQEYYEQVVNAIGPTISQELWAVVQKLPARPGNALETALRQEVLSSPKFGPIARNIIQLWYLGLLERAATGLAQSVRRKLSRISRKSPRQPLIRRA